MEQIVMAIRAINDPATTSEVRRQAGDFCEAFKQRDDCCSLAVQMMSSESDDIIRHFALHVLENTLKIKWNDFDANTMEGMRACFLDLMATKMRDMATEKHFVKEKLAKLVAEVAKRQFPQRWQSMWEQLQQVWSVGDTQIELVCLVLRSIAEDCSSSDFNLALPADRRRDILQGLHALFPSIYPLVFAHLAKQYALFSAADQQARGRARHLVAVALQMMQEFLPWVPLAEIVKPECNFFVVCCELLKDPDPIRLRASECLRILVTKKNVALSDARDNAMALFGNIVEAQRATEPLFAPPDHADAPSELATRRSLCRCVVGCGVAQLETVMEVHQMQQDAGAKQQGELMLQQYLKQQLDLLQHPSQRLTFDCLPLWLHIAKISKPASSTLRQFAWFPSLIPPLLDALAKKLLRVGRPDDEFDDPLPGAPQPLAELVLYARAATEWSIEEFGDDTEWLPLWTQLRSKLGVVLRTLAAQHPQEAVDLLHRQLQRGGGVFCTASDCTNECGYATVRSSSYLLLHAFSECLHCVLHPSAMPPSVYRLDPAGGDTTLGMRLCQLLQGVLQLVTDDPLLLDLQLKCLGEYTLLLARPKTGDVGGEPQRQAMLQAVVNKLIASVPFIPSATPAAPRGALGVPTPPVPPALLALPLRRRIAQSAPHTVTTRRRAATSMVKLCKNEGIAHVMLPGLIGMTQQVQAMKRADSLTHMENQLLDEVLILVSNAIPDAAQKEQFVSSLLAPVLQQWSASETIALVGTPEALLADLTVQPGGAHRPSLMRDRWTLLFSMHQILCVGKRLPVWARPQADQGERHPFAAQWPMILPSLFTLLRCMHALWAAELPYRAALAEHPIGRGIYCMSMEEMYSHLTPITPTADKKASTPSGTGIMSASSIDRDSFVAGAGNGDAGVADLDPAADSYARATPVAMASWAARLRGTCYSVLALCCHQRYLWTGEGQGGGEALGAAALRQAGEMIVPSLPSMEHRHMRSLMLHLLPVLTVQCPPSSYPLLIAILGPIVAEVEARLRLSWQSHQLVNASATSGVGAQQAPELAKWYPRSWPPGEDGGWGADGEQEEIVRDKVLRELTRAHLNFVTRLYVTGVDTACTEQLPKGKNKQRREMLQAKGTSPAPKGNRKEGIRLITTADGAATAEEEAVAASFADHKPAPIGLRRFLLFGSEAGAGAGAGGIGAPLLASAIGCLLWPDSFSCRRAVPACRQLAVQTLLGMASQPQQAQQQAHHTRLLGFDMCMALLVPLLQQPEHVSEAGLQWDYTILFKDVYCRLVLGQPFAEEVTEANILTAADPARVNAFGGSGANTSPRAASVQPISELPRRAWIELTGQSQEAVVALEAKLMACTTTSPKGHVDMKAQKSVMREAIAAVIEQRSGGAAYGSNKSDSAGAIIDLPEKLTLVSKGAAAQAASTAWQESGEVASALFELYGAK
jgi:exportin-5